MSTFSTLRAGLRNQSSRIVAVCCLAISCANLPAGLSAEHPANGNGTRERLNVLFEEHWAKDKIEPTFCDDATFLRRVYLDLFGRIPSVSETRDFLAESASDKREKLIDRLLFSDNASSLSNEIYAEHWARTWRRMMLPPGSTGAAMGPAFEPWLKEQFLENVGYDEMTKRLVSGRYEDNRIGTFYQAVGGTPEAAAGAVTRVFLGVRIACAQCHEHPFAQWKQKDFWGMAAFFSGVRQARPNLQGANPTPKETFQVSFEGTTYDAKFLWDQKETVSGKDGQTPRDLLADWITHDDNPNFAATAVNRVWQSLLGRGLIADVDDLDLASPEERGYLLDKLAKEFMSSGYNLRGLIAGILKSKAYQVRSVKDADTPSSPLYGTRPLKSLSPEQLFDSLEQALALPVTRTAEDSARHNGQRAQMVQRFNESAGQSPEDYAAGIPQALMLMNGKITADATDLETSRTLRAVVDAPFLNENAKLDTLYLATLNRKPTTREREVMLKHISSRKNTPKARSSYGEVFWALLNSPEFVLCR